MLIPSIPRIVTAFRHLNSRLVTLQPSLPLVRDAIQILGSSGSEVLLLADLRDAYQLKKLIENLSEYKFDIYFLKGRKCIYQIFYQDIQMMRILLMRLYQLPLCYIITNQYTKE